MKKNIFVVVGSTRANSSNFRLVNYVSGLLKEDFEFTFFQGLTLLPHFIPEHATENVPEDVIKLREQINQADAVLICTPEYVLSIPGSLKNLIEWCIATTIFQQKPVGLITASLYGEKGHEELKLIMETIGAKFTEDTTLLIQRISGKINNEGQITDEQTAANLKLFAAALKRLVIQDPKV